MALARNLIATAGVVVLATAAPALAAESVERYLYVSIPEHGDSASEETHDVTVTRSRDGIHFEFEILFDRGKIDRGAVSTDTTGAFVRAVRHRLGRDGATYQTDSLWVEGSEVRMETRRGSKIDSERVALPAGKPLAVDASLLLWMRGFRFGAKEAVDVFMADWEHRTVDIDVRDRGVETVNVPAGTFACHRMEITVRVLVFRPKITLWISVDEPHFLVQHRGKRGPFTAVFETRLARVGTP